MVVAWFEAKEWEKKFLANRDIDVEFFERPANVEDAEDFDDICVFIESSVSDEFLREVEPDRVFTRSTGFDHIDLEAAEDLGVGVFNVPHYGGCAVAEHAFALLLGVSRKLPKASEKASQNFDPTGLEGFELENKKIGIVGTGDIGQKTIKMAQGFNMDVIAYDPYPKKHLEDELGFMYVSKEDLIEKSDIISLHCPLTSENQYMLNSEEFAKMENTVLINTARGKLVNSNALLNGLENDSVRAAGLDVLELEEEMTDRVKDSADFCKPGREANCELLERDDTLITPHSAFNTEEAKKRILETTIANMRDEPEENRVN